MTDSRPAPVARVVVGPACAPTLVLLHGVTGSAVSQADALLHWAGLGYRVVALDARGHGLSPRWDDNTLADPGEQLVADVVDVLEELASSADGARAASRQGAPPTARDEAATTSSRPADPAARWAGAGTDPQPTGPAAPARPPVLMGHSMGAATAAVVAGRRPDLVTGVVLEDPARFGQRSPEELRRRGAARERARATDLVDLPGAVRRGLDSAETGTVPVDEVLVSVWATQRTDVGLLRSGVVAPEVPWEQAMASLRVPTLLVTGDEAGSARVGPEGLALARRLNPLIEGVLVPGADHQVRRTRPEGFYAAVDPWLDALARG